MKPDYGPGDENTALVTLDTGVYQIGELYSAEFQIYDETIMTPEALAPIMSQVASDIVARYREDGGKEIEYLGYQAKMVDGKLDGCLVLAQPGGYRRINEKTTLTEESVRAADHGLCRAQDPGGRAEA